VKFHPCFTPISRVTLDPTIGIVGVKRAPFTVVMPMRCRQSHSEPPVVTLPNLRFGIPEAARILRMSRAQIYHRIQDRSLRPQKDGARTYFTLAELERYVESCNPRPNPDARERPRTSRRRDVAVETARSARA
jgi:hypothetical protein